eukprot:1669554-Pleurochrysis_carterae.AAC.3
MTQTCAFNPQHVVHVRMVTHADLYFPTPPTSSRSGLSSPQPTLLASLANVSLFACGRWQYAPAGSDLPRTERLISAAVDVRLPLTFDESDLDLMAEVILAAVEDTVSEA